MRSAFHANLPRVLSMPSRTLKRFTRTAAPPRRYCLTGRISPRFRARCSARRAKGTCDSATPSQSRKSKTAQKRCTSCLHSLQALFLGLADGAAGLNARGAQKPRNLLQVQLDRVSAQDLRLRKLEADVPYGGHARFELRNILLKV